MSPTNGVRVPEYPLVLAGGRVIDPESGRDAVGDVVVEGDRVVDVSTRPARRTAGGRRGLVVCPGFVDLHSHGQAIPEQRLQALDGVTTALELEAGAVPVEAAYARAAAEGRPVNYGFSTSWALARMVELAGARRWRGRAPCCAHLGQPGWQAPAPDRSEAAVAGAAAGNDLAAGALGIGVLGGYAPQVDPAEYLAVAALAAEAGAPTFTHARPLVELDPDLPVDGAEEIVRAAGETGAHMHYCHVNSTSRPARRPRARAGRAVPRRRAATVTTEAYPYGAGSTGDRRGVPGARSGCRRWGWRPDAAHATCRPASASPTPRGCAELRADDPGRPGILALPRRGRPRRRRVPRAGRCCSPTPRSPATRCR